MRIVCQHTILVEYHALFVIFEKRGKILNCRLLQIKVALYGLNIVPDTKTDSRVCFEVEKIWFFFTTKHKAACGFPGGGEGVLSGRHVSRPLWILPGGKGS